MGRTTIEGTPVDGAADGYVTGSADGAESVLEGTDRTGMEDPYVGYGFVPVEAQPAQPRKKAPAKRRKTTKQAAAKKPKSDKSEAYAARKAAFLRGELPGYIRNKRGRIVNAQRSAAQLARNEPQEPERKSGGGLSGLLGRLFR